MCHQFMHSWMLRIVLLLAVASFTMTATADDANTLLTTSDYRVQKKYVPSYNAQPQHGTAVMSVMTSMQSVTRTDVSHSAYSSHVSPVGASSPYATTTASVNGPRRAPIGGNIGDPGAITVPLGDIPCLLFLALLAGLVLSRSSRASRR